LLEEFQLPTGRQKKTWPWKVPIKLAGFLAIKLVGFSMAIKLVGFPSKDLQME